MHEVNVLGPAGDMGEGPDLWAGVFGELRRHPLGLVALGVLALVHGLAIFAPLIANDRPYLLEAVDHGAFERARRSLVGVTAGLEGLAREGPEAYAAARLERPEAPAFEAAVELELAALERRLGVMRAALEENLHGPLDALQRQAREASDAILRRGDRSEARRAAADLVAAAKALRSDYALRRGDTEGSVELKPQRSYPLFEALSPPDIFFMVLWTLLILWPLWSLAVDGMLLGRLPGSLSGAGARRAKWAGVLGLSLGAAGLWSQTVAGDMPFDVSGYKTGLTSGEIEATRVVFPPLAMGFAETHVEESYRPPTWASSSEIDEDGVYLRGGRAPELHGGDRALHSPAPAATPVEVRFGEAGRNSPWRHPLGTDEIGRDLCVRMLYGARISLSVGLVSTLLVALIGIAVGALAGYWGGRVDFVLSRLIEIVQCIPAFFLILTAVAIVPARSLHPLFAIVLFIGLVRWCGIARLTRAECLRLREQEFVLAARAGGLSPLGVVWRHVLPNAMGPVLVAITFSAAAGILTESAISFLGFGVREPIPSWGSLLSESRATEHWWILLFPGLAIFATVLAYNLVGEAVRDALDPRRDRSAQPV